MEKKVGEEVRSHTDKVGSTIEVKVHGMCEDWLNQDFSLKHGRNIRKTFCPYTLFNELKNQDLNS